MAAYGKRRCVHCKAITAPSSVYCDACGNWQARKRGFGRSRSRHAFGIDRDVAEKIGTLGIVTFFYVYMAFLAAYFFTGSGFLSTLTACVFAFWCILGILLALMNASKNGPKKKRSRKRRVSKNYGI